MSGLVVTRLDVLSGVGPLQAATGYRVGGQELRSVPSMAADWARVEPAYERLDGWDADLTGARTWEDLPGATQAYVRRIEEEAECPTAILSVGPGREQTIVLRPELVWG